MVRLFFALLLLLSACAGRPAASSPAPREPEHDARLYAILDTLPLEGAALDSLERYRREYRNSFLERVAIAVEDSTAPTPVRYNAIMLLGKEGATAWLQALRTAQRASDLRVRGAVVAAAEAMLRAGRAEARGLIITALDDPAPEVQAKALQVLGTDSLPVLREFLRRHPSGPTADIARELLAAAEERGFPLEQDPAGVIRRQTSSGHRLEFVPLQRWEQWHAALGTVTITPASGGALTIDSVEVVRAVVPVAFSGDGRYVAWERARRIFIHDFEAGTTREVGPGIAPRTRPFAADIIFLRERWNGRNEMRERTRLSYDVLRVPFAPGQDPNTLGSLGVFVQTDRHGSYSPARWMHIAERDLKFSLEGEGLETFPLPDAFTDRDEL